MSTAENDDWDPDSYADDANDDGDSDGLPPKLSLVGFKLTDLGNAERFAARLRGQVRYCYGRKRWLVWGGKRWDWDDGGRIEALAKKVVRGIYSEAQRQTDPDRRKLIFQHAFASEKASAITAMLKLAQSEPGIPVELRELDANPVLLNCQNGTIDLESGKLRKHDQADLITKMCPCNYDPRATHPMLDRYLLGATRDDLEIREYIQRAAGYSIQGTVEEKALFFLYGPKDSAKSTFIDAMAAMLGDYHMTADEDTWMIQQSTGGNRGDIVRLAGARIVTTVEFKKGARFDESLMKKVTGGGDELTAAAKYEAEVTFRPSFALWFAANDAPAIRADDGGMWSRMRRIPFPHSIPKAEQDKNVRRTLISDPGARSALLAWSVQGYAKWKAHGLGSAAAIDASTAAYQNDMDPVADFISSELVFSPLADSTPRDIRAAYDHWAKEEGVKYKLGRKDFQAAIEKAGAKYRTTDGKRWVEGVRRKGEWE